MPTLHYCRPCRNAGRVRRAVVRIDAEPLCATCARGDGDAVRPYSSVQRDSKTPPENPLFLIPTTAAASQTPEVTVQLQRIVPLAPAATVNASTGMPLRRKPVNSAPVKYQPSMPLRMAATRHPVRRIIDLVAAAWGIRFEDVAIARRRKYSLPRQIAMYLAHKRGISLALIGRHIGFHHTTVLYAVRVGESRIQGDPVIRKRVEAIERELQSACDEVAA